MNRMNRREMDDADAGARFDALVAIFKNAWAEQHPSEPFEVNGVITPGAMEYLRGWIDGLQAGEEPAKEEPDQN
jgi:hypothetical protein